MRVTHDWRKEPGARLPSVGGVGGPRYLRLPDGRGRLYCFGSEFGPGGYFNDQPQPFLEQYCRRVPVGRMLGHNDLQGAVVFLASDASEYVTGLNLMVDGGWTCL